MASRGSRNHAALDRRRWRRVRRQVLDRDGWRCRECGRYGNEVDHVRPLKDGGQPYALDNLQTLDRGCHIRKTASENTRPDPARDAWRELVERMERES